MNNCKKVGLIFCEDDVWNRYSFQKEKIDLSQFKNKKYKKFNLTVSKKEDGMYFYDYDLIFLKKLEIEGIKNNIIFDHYKNFRNECDYLIIFGLYKIRKNEQELIKLNKKKILYIAEPRAVDSTSYKKDLHKYFDIIFSNDYFLVDNEKCFFTTGIHNVCKENSEISEQIKENLLCSFVTNRNLTGYKSTSKKKKLLINFFSSKIPNDFHLYGDGWDKFLIYKSDILSKIINKLLFYIYKITLLKKILKNKNKSYKGLIEDKILTCGKYKFELVIENSLAAYRNTDRIISTFFSGSVPLYYGPETIYDLVPGNCFIDLRKFENENEVLVFLKNISVNKYRQYLINIRNFINSDKFYHFTADKTVKKFINEIKKFEI